MKNRPGNNVAYIVSIALITLFFGCTVEQTHKTLVFFFDGVDRVIFHNSYLTTDSMSVVAARKRDALLKKNRPDLCVHQPYKEKKCDACHTPDQRLLMPMPGLCFKCHNNFSETYAVVHGPVGAGACLNCHNQHSSKYPKLLIRQGQQLCVYCHNSSTVFTSKVHKDIEDVECTLCHNPHGGKSRYMLKDNIPKDGNRIALMDEITYRHLYGQVFCKTPGDVNNVMDIYILDEKANTVATVHPDAEGKFFLANIHPDQNYTFRFKKDFPDCRINVTDNNGALVYVIQKNKKGKYGFDKTAYEAVHNAINDAHFLGDTAVLSPVPSREQVATDNALRDTAAPLPFVGHTQMADTIGHPENIPVNVVQSTTEAQPGLPRVNADVVTDTSANRGKIVVNELPENVPSKDFVGKKNPDAVPKSAGGSKSPNPEKTNTETVADSNPETNGKRKIIVASITDTSELPAIDKFRTVSGANDIVSRMEAGGIKLTDLTSQVGVYYDGTVVCVLNESGDLLDIASVNEKGEFYLYDFLYFRLSLPGKSSGIASQTIYINEKMEVIETINKRPAGGHFVYVLNSKENQANKAVVKIFTTKENAVLFSSVYFDEGRPSITVSGCKELGKVVAYLNDHPSSNVYLLAHASSMGTPGFNKQLTQKRADATANYLTAKGINGNRIKIKGNRKNRAVRTVEITPGSAEEDQKNRRVDVYIKIQ